LTAYRAAVAVLALVFVGIGIAIAVETAIHGGGLGLILGPLFVLLGLGRLYLLRSRS
jgi:hypothetical protein